MQKLKKEGIITQAVVTDIISERRTKLRGGVSTTYYVKVQYAFNNKSFVKQIKEDRLISTQIKVDKKIAYDLNEGDSVIIYYLSEEPQNALLKSMIDGRN